MALGELRGEGYEANVKRAKHQEGSKSRGQLKGRGVVKARLPMKKRRTGVLIWVRMDISATLVERG